MHLLVTTKTISVTIDRQVFIVPVSVSINSIVAGLSG